MKKILVALCALMAGCTFQTKHRGYVFPSDLAGQVENIKT